jgi:hypothetical protein
MSGQEATSNDFVTIDDNDGFRRWYASLEQGFKPVYLLRV